MLSFVPLLLLLPCLRATPTSPLLFLSFSSSPSSGIQLSLPCKSKCNLGFHLLWKEHLQKACHYFSLSPPEIKADTTDYRVPVLFWRDVGDGINRNWSEWVGWLAGWLARGVRMTLGSRQAGRQASAMTPYSLSVRLSLLALKLQSGICFCSKMVCSHTTCFQNINNNKNLN